MTWCPAATKLPFEHSDGGSYVRGVPFRGILHTTESNVYYPSTTSYYGHRNPPHLTVTRNGKAYQHYSTSRAARALRHPRGTQHTNRLRAIQIEIVGMASAIGNMPEVQRLKVREVMRWVEKTHNVKPEMPLQFRGSEAYGDTPWRMSEEDWAACDFWAGHQHVGSGNQHWDPGKLDPGLLLPETLTWKVPGDLQKFIDQDVVPPDEDLIRCLNYQDTGWKTIIPKLTYNELWTAAWAADQAMWWRQQSGGPVKVSANVAVMTGESIAFYDLE